MPTRRSARPEGHTIDLGTMHVTGLQSRRVRAFVPGAQPREPRPLLVLFDGQNVFEDEGSYAGGWRAHKAVQRAPRRPDRAPVVVGIDHGGHARIDELAPWSDGRRGGQFPQLLRWLADELTPTLRAHLPVSSRAEDTAIGGSSMGGLAALYAHWERPDVFGRCLAMSPSLWFAGGQFFRWMARRQLPDTSRIYLDVGMRETRHMVRGTERLAHTLVSQGYRPHNLGVLLDPRGHHRESSWRRRFPKAIRFLLA